MKEFLDQVWFDNSIRSYLVVAGIILLTLILKRIISRYFAFLLFKGVRKIWKGVDRQSFISLLIQPLSFFLFILISIISLHKLRFPSELNIEIYQFHLKDIILRIATTILIVSFIWLILRMIDFIAGILEKRADLTPDHTDNQLIVFFRDFFKVIFAIIGIVMVLNYAFNLNVGSLITGLSIVGAAIALSLRESLENLIASFVIFFDKPFTTGDYIKVHQIAGTVEKIGLRSTRIRTDYKTMVSVPNKQMVDSILDNHSMRTQRRGDLRIEAGTTATSSVIDTFISRLRKDLERKEIETANVFLSEITGNAVIISSDYYTAPVTIREFNSLKQDIHLRVLALMEELGIDFASQQNQLAPTR